VFTEKLIRRKDGIGVAIEIRKTTRPIVACTTVNASLEIVKNKHSAGRRLVVAS
jgi:hypothetical protein